MQQLDYQTIFKDKIKLYTNNRGARNRLGCTKPLY